MMLQLDLWKSLLGSLKILNEDLLKIFFSGGSSKIRYTKSNHCKICRKIIYFNNLKMAIKVHVCDKILNLSCIICQFKIH